TAPIRASVSGDTITLMAPPAEAQVTAAGIYRAAYRPNERLAGLVRAGDEGEKRLVPLAFAEVALPQAPVGSEPRLRSKLPDNNWVFIWDARRRTGWLLVALPATAERDIRFRIDWPASE